MVGTKLATSTRLSTTLKLDPRVVLSSNLLQLSSVELCQSVEQELSQNPALMRLDESNEPSNLADVALETARRTTLSGSREDYEGERSGTSAAPSDLDWTDLVAGTQRLEDHLMAQLGSLTEDRRVLAEYLIANIDDRGYLTSTVEEIAASLGSSMEAVEEVLHQIQACEPAGVGARGAVECITLQLDRIGGELAELASRIARQYLDALIQRDTKFLARRLAVTPAVVSSAFDLIESLSPYPCQGFMHTYEGRFVRSNRATPEIVFVRSEAGWLLEIQGIDPEALAIARHQRMATPNDTVRAERFIQALQHRKHTMWQIGNYLLQVQAGYISTGDARFLNDLTRAKVASDLGIHESTVSRATQDKHVQLATGEIVPFDRFFDSSLRVKELIAEILMYENPNNPLSDERIAAMLAEKGVKIARRTVNKYREKSRLLSSRRRKSA